MHQIIAESFLQRLEESNYAISHELNSLGPQEVLLHLNALELIPPAVAISDMGMGLWATLEEKCPKFWEQLCWCYKTENVFTRLGKCPAEWQKALQDIWHAEIKANSERAFEGFLENYYTGKRRPHYLQIGEMCGKDLRGLRGFNQLLKVIEGIQLVA